MKFDFSKLFKAKGFANEQTYLSMMESGNWSNSGNLTSKYSTSVFVYACVNKIAQKFVTVDYILRRYKNSKGEMEEIFIHPILDLLYKCNPFQTRSEFLRIAVVNKLLTGEAYWLKVRNSQGVPVELYNLRPDLVTVVRDPNNYIKHYEFNNGRKTVLFAREDVIAFRNPDPMDPLRGISPLQPAKLRIETEEKASQYQRNFFANNARPDFLFVTDESLSPEEREEMKESWNQEHRGGRNSGRFNILEGGLKYQQVSISQREMDYIESMKATRDDIMVAFGIPKGVITSDDVRYNNSQAAIVTFLSETVKPEMQYFVEVINEMLVIPDFGREYELFFEDPVPSDRDAKLKEYQAGVDKWLTANEIRQEMGLEPAEGGDVLYRQATAEPAGAVKRLTENPEKNLKGKGRLVKELAYREAVTDIKRRAVAKYKEKAGVKNYLSLLGSDEVKEGYYKLVNKRLDERSGDFKAAVLEVSREQKARVLANLEGKKAISEGQILNRVAENKLFAEMALPYFETLIAVAGKEALELVASGESFQVTPSVRDFLRQRADFFAETVNNTTLRGLSDTLSEGIEAGEGISELSARVERVYEDIEDWRAELIARTEATAVNNEGFIEGYRQSGVVVGKEWIATMDERVREEHANLHGEIVGLDDAFSNGLEYPSEPNCRCVVAPAVAE